MDEANNPQDAGLAEDVSEEIAPEIEEPETQIEADESSEASDDVETTETDEVDGEEPTAEFVTVEYDGMEYEVPNNLKDALMRQQDYTKKTQTIAEQRKEIEQQAAALQQQSVQQQQTFEEAANLRSIDQQLEQYNALNWDELYQGDMATAVNLDRQKRDLETQRQETVGRLQQGQAQAVENQRIKHAKVLEEGQKVLATRIKDWTPELAQKVAAYGISRGLKEQAVQSITDPVHVELIDKARRYDELMAKQTVKPAAQPAQAAIKVKGKRAAVNKDPDKMDVNDWLKMRNQQVQKRNSA